MKKVESIWAELSAKAQEVAQESTELSEEVKVDLSKVDDAAQLYKQLSDKAGDASVMIDKATVALKKLISERDALEKIANDIEQSAKELGVDVSLNYIRPDKYKNLEKVIADLQSAANQL